MAINREELSRLERRFPLVKARKLPKHKGFSDVDYVNDNLRSAAWLLDNSKLLLEVLEKYRRITEITFEGEKLSE